MSVVALTGSDTVQINNRVLRNLGDGNVTELRFPNDLVGVKTGKNGNTVYSLNATGQQAELDLRVIRGSDDDAFLEGLLVVQQADLPSFELMEGYFTKRIGDGSGSVAFDSYIMDGGVFMKIPEATDNVEGDTNQALAIYRLKFGNAKRSQM